MVGLEAQLTVDVTSKASEVNNRSKHTLSSNTTMVSIVRYVRNIRRIGIKQWWHQMQYIGDAKAGTLVGVDQ